MSFAMWFLSCLHLALKCVLPAIVHSAMVLRDGTCYGRILERKACFAMILSSPVEFGLVWLLANPGLALRRAPRLLMSDCETAMAVARKACCHPSPGVYPMSGIICSQGGHLIAEQMAKAFSSAWTPRHLCLPGILASLLKAVQSKKALFQCISVRAGWQTRAAQFIKALTGIVWRVVGRRTSLRPVQCTKVNSGISSTLVEKLRVATLHGRLPTSPGSLAHNRLSHSSGTVRNLSLILPNTSENFKRCTSCSQTLAPFSHTSQTNWP